MNSTGLELYRIDLKTPLLIMRGGRGLLASGYLDVDTFNLTGEAAAIVEGVNSFDDMLAARVVAVSHAAVRLGMGINMTGAEVVERICQADPTRDFQLSLLTATRGALPDTRKDPAIVPTKK